MEQEYITTLGMEAIIITIIIPMAFQYVIILGMGGVLVFIMALLMVGTDMPIGV